MKINFKHRHNARIAVTQSLYSWLMNGNSSKVSLTNFLSSEPQDKVDFEYLIFLYDGVVDNKDGIDNMIKNHITRPINEVGPIELSILRYSVFEMLNTKLDFKIVINEAIEITKKFGPEESSVFVNACLDSIYKSTLLK